MATRGDDLEVSGRSEVVGAEGGGGGGMGADVRSGFVSVKLFLCRFPGKHIPKIRLKYATQ